jgi:TonB family protein
VHPKFLMAVVVRLVLPALVLVGCIRAQDVTVTPLEWVQAANARDQLPKPAGTLEVYFPHDLRNTPDFGYVVVGMFLNEKGEHLGHHVTATLPAYEVAISGKTQDWAFQPGRRAGQPINTFTRFVVIFNPASAGLEKADATPRLLRAEVVEDPALSPRAGEKAPAPAVVWATVALDASGRATAVKDASAELSPLLEKSLPAWRFAPARRQGLAVAAAVRVPFILVAPGNTRVGDYTPAQATNQVTPDYPDALRKSGLRGEVVIDFVVDRAGKVTEAHVVRSLNPAFEQATLDALYQWTFAPARREGVPVSCHLRETFTFQHEQKIGGGASGIAVEKQADQSRLPPDFRYDVPPKPRGLPTPVYPYALLRDGIRGKARVSFVIGVDGRIVSTSVISADRPEFGAALQAAVENYQFEPALRGGRPTACLYSAEQDFSDYDSDRLVFHKDRTLLALEAKHPERIAGASHLDAKLAAISTRAPEFPLSLRGRVPRGSAVVEVLVDEQGRVRLPRCVSASDPAFGYAAVHAVISWRFEPPKIDGSPVVVRVRIPFEFAGADGNEGTP